MQESEGGKTITPVAVYSDPAKMHSPKGMPQAIGNKLTLSQREMVKSKRVDLLGFIRKIPTVAAHPIGLA